MKASLYECSSPYRILFWRQSGIEIEYLSLVMDPSQLTDSGKKSWPMLEHNTLCRYVQQLTVLHKENGAFHISFGICYGLKGKLALSMRQILRSRTLFLESSIRPDLILLPLEALLRNII